MRFDYYSSFEDWAVDNGYDPDDFLSEEILLQKSYSKIIRFYIAKEDGTYAQVHAYHSPDDGIFDVTIEKEGLRKYEKVIQIKKVTYK